MRRKFIALFMIAIMAFTVCSTVAMTTTQKVAAASTTTQQNPITITYKPGAKYTIWEWQFKNYRSDFTPAVGEPKHFEIVYDGITYSWVSATPSQSGGSWVSTGPLLKLDLKGADWNIVKTKPCKLTYYVTYNLAVKGDGFVIAYTDLGTMGYLSWRKEVGTSWNRPTDNVSGRETLTYSGLVGLSPNPGVPHFFSSPSTTTPYVSGSPTLGIFNNVENPGGAEGGPYVGGQNTATLICSKIVIEFPAS